MANRIKNLLGQWHGIFAKLCLLIDKSIVSPYIQCSIQLQKMSFLVNISVIDTYCSLGSSINFVFKNSFVWTFTKVCSMSFNLWKIGISSSKVYVYLLPLEIFQLLDVKSKKMNIILKQLLNLMCLTSYHYRTNF